MDKDLLTKNRFLDEAEIPMELVILLIVGMTLVITGALLFPISSDGWTTTRTAVGLLLVIFRPADNSHGEDAFRRYAQVHTPCSPPV